MILNQRSLDISEQNLSKNSASHIGEALIATKMLNTLIMHNL